MTIPQIKSTEEEANKLIKRNEEVYAKESPLAIAKTIQGLRAMFDETYPDPVRVVSIGIPVEQMEADPTQPAGHNTSVEFCGGTHLRRAGHIGNFIVASEEAIAKGIRRIIALTGPEAEKAICKADLLSKRLSDVKNIIEDPKCTLNQKEMVKCITDLSDDISAATISYWRKDEMRTKLKGKIKQNWVKLQSSGIKYTSTKFFCPRNIPDVCLFIDLKKSIDDKDKARKAKVLTVVIDHAKQIAELNKGIPYIICELDAYAQNKALDGALKQIKAITSTTSAMFISADKDANKVLCMAQVSKEALGKGLKANEWCAQVQKVR